MAVEAPSTPNAMTPVVFSGGDWTTLAYRLQTETAVLVVVAHTQGSVPRETGAWMAVFAHDLQGTIGGGRLEWEAIGQARRMLTATDRSPLRQRVPLGPSLGQCCGGVVVVEYTRVDARDLPALHARWQSGLQPVALFGAGHVGHAMVQALNPLPFQVRWIDSRDSVFPPQLPPTVWAEHSDPVHHAVADLAPHSHVLIMSFSHAEDLDIVAACLDRWRVRHDLPFIGLIGSRTKWATFRHRLEARGYTDDEMGRITCPIGVPGVRGKAPAVIAASVAAQLLSLAPTGAWVAGTEIA